MDRGLPQGTAARRPLAGEAETVLTLAAGLAALQVGAKLLLLPFPVSTLGEFFRWLLRLAIVAAPDLLFLVAFTAVCLAVTLCVQPWPRGAALWRAVLFGLFYLAGLYAIVSVPVYQVMKVPLTLPLVSFAGGPLRMASSIDDLVPLPLVAGALLLPALGLLLPVLLSRFRWRPARRVATPRLLLAAALATLVYAAVCHAYVEKHWTDPNRWERRIARSPHAVLLVSCARECLKERPLTFTAAFPDADESDFQSEPHGRGETIPGAERGSGGDLWAEVFADAERPTNVLLIVLESTGVEYLGLYGSKYPTTPNLERLAAERGLVFDHAYVQTPNSCKSLVALTASVCPRVDWRLIVRDCPGFNVPTMAAVLRREHYRTCFLHSGYWSWKGRDEYLLRRGVQHLIDADRLAGAEVNSWGVSDRAMYEAALEWIDQRPRDPFFVFAYTIETHHPYVAPGKSYDFGVDDPELARYLNAVRAADEHIGWLMEELAARGLDRSTLVAITADHGESFGQHDQRVHSFGLYEPDVHVPLVLLHPAFGKLKDRLISRGGEGAIGETAAACRLYWSTRNGDSLRLSAGPRLSPAEPTEAGETALHCAALAQHIDIPATLLAALGIDRPAVWQGRDLGEEPRERAYFFSTGNEVVLGLREGSWKYHYYVDSGREELFDLAADRGELKNLADLHSDRCDGYRRRVAGLVEYQRRFLAEHGAE